MSASTPIVLSINGIVKLSDLTAKAFLTKCPRGAYTTARTVDQTRIFEFEAHIQRLANTLGLMNAQPPLPLEKGSVSRVVVPPLRQAMKAFIENSPSQTEMRITVVITNKQIAEESWDASSLKDETQQSLNVSIHISNLPPPPKPPVKVIVRGSPRKNAAAKDSAWVIDRQGLEAQMPSDYNETVLADDDRVYEGLTSNFFAFHKGALITAPEGTVLAGTVRQMAIEICKKDGIPVIEEAPSLANAKDWSGCFVSSTSRLMAPVDVLSLPEAQGQPIYSYATSGSDAHPTVVHIANRVKELLRESSTDVFEYNHEAASTS
eukprot:TRINITY_DN4712_c0_g1_i2.p1 TRINITY_DN4712_c0_g1~~TRINITY_DN4712_c0_g1_i2.p1  ORF type:complete len:320 (-),score=76.02 TRINITY_DN4712_c0_g1_i2:571-1530(-)